jgi:hypothetical protein
MFGWPCRHLLELCRWRLQPWCAPLRALCNYIVRLRAQEEQMARSSVGGLIIIKWLFPTCCVRAGDCFVPLYCTSTTHRLAARQDGRLREERCDGANAVARWRNSFQDWKLGICCRTRRKWRQDDVPGSQRSACRSALAVACQSAVVHDSLPKYWPDDRYRCILHT